MFELQLTSSQFRYREAAAAAGGPMPVGQAPRPSFTLADSRPRQQRPGSAQQRYMSQSRNAFSAPTRFDNMDQINEIGDDREWQQGHRLTPVDMFQA